MTNANEKLAALEAALPDLLDGGSWMVEAVETSDTLADFEAASQGWAECSAKTIRGTVAGMPFVAWEHVQVRKGDRRRPLAVIDLGDKRVALDDDASFWRV